jgi:secondary thiamine-phosphate synthase enzyme
MINTFKVKTSSRTELVDITSYVKKIVDESGTKSGICHIFVPHTTSAVTINEGADPSVVRDMIKTLNEQYPQRADYHHMEGNSDAHIKTSIIGSSETVIIENGKLKLGTWQAIFFCEFDGARSRTVHLKIMRE